MSLDSISVKIGVQDVASLAEAVRLMDRVATMSGDVVAAVNAAAAGAANVGSKAQQATSVIPQLKGLMDVLAEAFSKAFNEWKGLNSTAKEEMASIKADLGELISDLRAATDALRADFTSMANTATVRGLTEKMKTMQAGWQQQGDVGESVSNAVSSSIGTALEGLGQRMDEYAKNASAAATGAVDAVKAGVDQIKVAAEAMSKLQQGTDIAAQIQSVVDAALTVINAQQAAQIQQPVKQSSGGGASDDAVRSIYTMMLPDWPLMRDRLYEMRDKVNDIDNNTKDLGFKIDKLREGVMRAASASRSVAKKVAALVPGGDIGEDDVLPQAQNKGAQGGGDKTSPPRGTPANGKHGRRRM